MDNLTHTLVGIAIGRAGLGRDIPCATALLAVSANAPDLDFVSGIFGAQQYFEWHRGYSHSLLLAPLLAGLSVLLVALISRRRLPWMAAFGLACVGVTSHLLLDWTNTYGVRLLLPWSSQWFRLDTTYLYDGVLMAVLVAGIAFPLLALLVSGEIGERSKPGFASARVALLFFVLYDGARYLLHERTLAQLSTRLFDGAPAISAVALPTPFNPMRWGAIVESSEAHYWYAPASPDAILSDSPEVFEKIPLDEPMRTAEQTRVFRYFTYFAGSPVRTETRWEREGTLPTGRRIELSDLRFGKPGSGSFHALAYIDAQGKLVGSYFTFGAAPPPQ